MSESAVQYFVPNSANAPRTLRQRLEEQHIQLVRELASSQDWPDFKERRGRILGLERAISICVDIESETN